jgi:hypothetical protein
MNKRVRKPPAMLPAIVVCAGLMLSMALAADIRGALTMQKS